MTHTAGGGMKLSETRHLPRKSAVRWRPRYLLSKPDFLSGLASVLNISGHLPRMYRGRDPYQADFEAIYGDWLMIGQDIENVMRRYEEKYAEQLARQAPLFELDEETKKGS